MSSLRTNINEVKAPSLKRKKIYLNKKLSMKKGSAGGSLTVLD